MYFREESERTPEQEEGLRFHKKWEDTIRASKKLSIGKTRLEFEAPEPELKVHVPYKDFYILSAVFDCVDGETLYEFKTGKTSAFEYATGLQIPFYFLTLREMKRKVKRAYVIRWNQYEEKSELVLVRNSPKKIEEAENLVDTVGAELYSYLEYKELL